MNYEISVLWKKFYPETLQNMPGVPRNLYIRGQLPRTKDQKYLCVIGSRRATTYGKDCVNKILRGLKGYPISIVSGLAQGMDSYAHEAALEAGLHCIGFPGSNLSWPALTQRNPILPRRILDAGGALISKWPHDYDVGNWGFPVRNMLMAGIAHAVLIIESTKGSGSLLTAKHAEEYNRDVMVVPGPIDADLSYGGYMLAKKGAALITTADDILNEFGFAVSKNERRLVIMDQLDPVSRRIYQAVSLSGNVTLDTLIERTSLDPLTLNENLSKLELEGLIQVTGSGIKLV